MKQHREQHRDRLVSCCLRLLLRFVLNLLDHDEIDDEAVKIRRTALKPLSLDVSAQHSSARAPLPLTSLLAFAA